MERRSRNTYENADFTKAIAAPKAGRALAPGDVGLSHAALDRSVSQGGICGRAYPVDWRVGGRDDSFLSPMSPPTGLAEPISRVREWIGLLAYRLTGKTERVCSRDRRQDGSNSVNESG